MTQDDLGGSTNISSLYLSGSRLNYQQKQQSNSGQITSGMTGKRSSSSGLRALPALPPPLGPLRPLSGWSSLRTCAPLTGSFARSWLLLKSPAASFLICGRESDKLTQTSFSVFRTCAPHALEALSIDSYRATVFQQMEALSLVIALCLCCCLYGDENTYQTSTATGKSKCAVMMLMLWKQHVLSIVSLTICSKAL